MRSFFKLFLTVLRWTVGYADDGLDGFFNRSGAYRQNREIIDFSIWEVIMKREVCLIAQTDGLVGTCLSQESIKLNNRFHSSDRPYFCHVKPNIVSYQISAMKKGFSNLWSSFVNEATRCFESTQPQWYWSNFCAPQKNSKRNKKL